MRRTVGQLIAALAPLAAALAGCGAPLKSAADVRSQLALGVPLGEQLAAFCKDLGANELEPDMRAAGLTVGDCRDAGDHAFNLTGMKTIQFARRGATAVTIGSDKIQRLGFRLEVWLNRDLLDLAGRFASAMQAAAASQGAPNALAAGGKPDLLGQLVTATVNVVGRPQLDVAAGRFNAAVGVDMNGAVLVHNTLGVTGYVGRDAIAAAVSTTGTPPSYKESIVRSLTGLALLVPYAGDVYLDLSMSVDIYSLGIDAIVEQSLNLFVGSSLKIVNQFLGSIP